MNEGQMKMASERRTEQRTDVRQSEEFSKYLSMPPEVLCKAAMGSPFTAKECWLALTEALSVRSG